MSGVDLLDHYFRQQASQDLRGRVAATFVFVETATSAIAGFYTLSAASLRTMTIEPAIVRALKLPRYPDIPAILIGRFAVALRYQGQRIGTRMMADALVRYGRLGDIGHIGLVVDAKDDRARTFYERHGFQRLAIGSYRLLLPRATIDKASS